MIRPCIRPLNPYRELPAPRRGYRCGPLKALKFWTGSDGSGGSCSGIHAWGRRNIRRGNRAGQNLYHHDTLSYGEIYHLTLEIPKQILIDGYPTEIKTLGDLIRKTRMDHGLEIKELGMTLDVDECTVTNWELRSFYPTGDNLRRVVEFIDTHQSEPIPRKTLWSLCFAKNPSYPQNVQSLGDKIRATRMENFMSIGQLAEKLGVNECTITKWELKGTQPRSDLLKRIQAFLASNGSEPSG